MTTTHTPRADSGAGPARAPHIVPPPPERPDSIRRAAILIMSLDEPFAGRLLDQLGPDLVELLAKEIARLERVDPAEQQEVLASFAEQARRRLRFGFHDLERLDPAALRIAFAPEDAPTWALALAGAPRGARTRLLAALPAASAETLRQQSERIGAFRLADVESAQAEILDHLRRLHDHGHLDFPEAGETEDPAGGGYS